MKDKKAAKKMDQPSSGSAAIGGQEEANQDQTAQDLKSAASTPAVAPTLVAEGDQPNKGKQKKAAAKSEKHGKPPKASKAAKEEKKPLNFKVSSDFRREFKTYASAHDLKLSKLLELAFESFRKHEGD
jgi:hypothetical protein